MMQEKSLMSTHRLVIPGLVAALALSACEIVDKKPAAAKKTDTAAAARAVVAESARGSVAPDSTATATVPNSTGVAAPDSNGTGATSASNDTTLLQTYPP